MTQPTCRSERQRNDLVDLRSLMVEVISSANSRLMKLRIAAGKQDRYFSEKEFSSMEALDRVWVTLLEVHRQRLVEIDECLKLFPPGHTYSNEQLESTQLTCAETLRSLGGLNERVDKLMTAADKLFGPLREEDVL